MESWLKNTKLVKDSKSSSGCCCLSYKRAMWQHRAHISSEAILFEISWLEFEHNFVQEPSFIKVTLFLIACSVLQDQIKQMNFDIIY